MTLYTFLIITHSIFLRMQNVAGKCCGENQNTHFMLSNLFFNNRAIYEMWKNIVVLERPQMTIWHMVHFTLGT